MKSTDWKRDAERLENLVPESIRRFLMAMLACSKPTTRARILLGWTHILLRNVRTTKARARRIADLDSVGEYCRGLVERAERDHAERKAFDAQRPEALARLLRRIERGKYDLHDEIAYVAWRYARSLPGPNGECFDDASENRLNELAVSMLAVLCELLNEFKDHPAADWVSKFDEEPAHDKTDAMFLLCAHLARGWLARDWRDQCDEEARRRRAEMTLVSAPAPS